MQTLSKTELAWIYSALEKSAKEDLRTMREVGEGNIAYSLAELHKENCRSVMHKIGIMLADGDKRIAIK